MINTLIKHVCPLLFSGMYSSLLVDSFFLPQCIAETPSMLTGLLPIISSRRETGSGLEDALLIAATFNVVKHPA